MASAIAWASGLPAAPIVCGAVNLVAALAMLFVLAPGTPLAEPAQRAAYVQANQLEWRAGWLTWIAAALSLLWFYVWWRARVGAHHLPLVIAALGLVADLTAELALIYYLAAATPLAFTLTGGVANGLYTIAGIALTAATPLSAFERVWAGVMWSAGLALSAAAFAGEHLATAVATAVLFALFCPWCVYLGVKLR
ncbi:MAG TPA: hypothetical protein VJP45_13225 [Candidatus Limnocylindria bacterium]|nr:hypothetical protein [Candidatus Limnocylindria bacterium]